MSTQIRIPMIKRDAEEKLRILATGFPAVSVIGPRQLGKTTLVEEISTSSDQQGSWFRIRI